MEEEQEKKESFWASIKTKPKIFIVFWILVALILIGSVVLPLTVSAQGGDPPAVETAGPCSDAENLGNCIVSIYRWALGVAVLLALAMIIFSGYFYMSAGGDAQKVQSAKDMFANAFIGLIILFSAVLILRTINPDLVRFRDLEIEEVSTSVPPTGSQTSASSPADAFSVQLNPEVSDRFARALGLSNYSIDAFGNISLSNGYTLTPVLNSGACVEIGLGLEENGLDSSRLQCQEYTANDPSLTPSSITSQIDGDQPNKVIVVIGSVYVFNGDKLYAGGGILISDAINLIAYLHFGVNLGDYVDVGNDPRIVFVPDDDSSGGFTGDSSGGFTGHTGSRPACQRVNYCEDRDTGERTEPTASGCQDPNDRQVVTCIRVGSEPSDSCNEILFQSRTCSEALDDIRVPGGYDYTGLPTSPGDPGTVYTEPSRFVGGDNGLLCSYEDKVEALNCGAYATGVEWCLPGNPVPGCIEP